MTQRKFVHRGIALAAAVTLALTACGDGNGGSDDPTEGEGGGSAEPLVVGTLLPITGTLAFLGPPEVAGVGVAVDEINEAGGVLGNDVELVETDSGDTTDLNVSTQSATELISQGANVVIGAASSGVSLNVVDQLTEAGVMMISPANTSTTLSGYSPLYSRTAPPDTVQGAALGSLILDEGYTRVGMLVQNEDYGTGLRNVVEDTLTAGGGEIVYGGADGGQEFQPGETNFSAQVTSLLAQEPDAILIIAFDETQAIISELVGQNWDMTTTFYTDGNTASYEDGFDAGTLAGALGTIPGARANDEFRALLSDWYEENEGSPLTDYSYGPESYDAVILAALAAIRGGATDGQTIADNLRAVSGSEEGSVEVATFAEGVEALENGDEINYQPVSGVGPINEDMDPSSAFIGIYEFDDNNVPIYQRSIEGNIG
ncbi:ABC transporter substrate-binding protein [Oerskovia flava]|uniref:ABC transporter substrate-binding protein n=1 Tax=Oerskovia flava TaxID=2986422 RepID=UPI00224003D5|nr:ABC transporter substrate-binding protein [Oerskovia sp. JB1-3-2]